MIDLKLTISEYITIEHALEDRVKKMNEFIELHIKEYKDKYFIMCAQEEIEECKTILNKLKNG